jgi:hypothetical protein
MLVAELKLQFNDQCFLEVWMQRGATCCKGIVNGPVCEFCWWLYDTLCLSLMAAGAIAVMALWPVV